MSVTEGCPFKRIKMITKEIHKHENEKEEAEALQAPSAWPPQRGQNVFGSSRYLFRNIAWVESLTIHHTIIVVAGSSSIVSSPFDKVKGGCPDGAPGTPVRVQARPPL